LGDGGERGGFPSCGSGEKGEESWLAGVRVKESGGVCIFGNFNERVFLARAVGDGEGVGGVESPIAVHDELVGLGSWGKRETEGPEVSFFSFEGVGGGVPSVKGACEADRFF
jgi:hypothetical protein